MVIDAIVIVFAVFVAGVTSVAICMIMECGSTPYVGMAPQEMASLLAVY